MWLDRARGGRGGGAFYLGKWVEFPCLGSSAKFVIQLQPVKENICTLTVAQSSSLDFSIQAFDPNHNEDISDIAYTSSLPLRPCIHTAFLNQKRRLPSASARHHYSAKPTCSYRHLRRLCESEAQKAGVQDLRWHCPLLAASPQAHRSSLAEIWHAFLSAGGMLSGFTVVSELLISAIQLLAHLALFCSRRFSCLLTSFGVTELLFHAA